ncbi:MAG: DUF4921 family protein [Candidatus Woesearchaeota archaeon]|nr:DUF4921 family protein [Candidatus Woesearchaeota archaeon]
MELRKDYLLDRWVIITEGRKRRPREFKRLVRIEPQKTCPFCPGHENLSPPEIYRVTKDGKWSARVIPNKFPAVSKVGSANIITRGFLERTSAYGSHEIVIETPFHTKQLSDLPIEDQKEIFKVYALRVKELLKDPKAKYVVVFKNEGKEGGASLQHSHAQIISYPIIPTLVREELNAFDAYMDKNYGCPYCKIIKQERNSPRFIKENGSFIAFAPYASRFNYEAWIFPKKHFKTFTDFTDREFHSLAEIINLILDRVMKVTDSYNLYFHYAPAQHDFHFHVEIAPRIAYWAGFEFSTNDVMNTISPEKAAKFYRKEK